MLQIWGLNLQIGWNVMKIVDQQQVEEGVIM
jgi:hypothetical protein